MNEKAKAFIELAKADPELAEKLTSMTADELVAAAKAKGVELAAEDLAPAGEPLDEADLDNVAGGGCSCSFLGSGAGDVGAADKKPYFCECTFGGQGDGDTSTRSLECLCMRNGTGYDA